MSIIRTQPALVTSTVTAVIVLLVAFGVPISDDQRAAVVAAVAAVLALLAGATTHALATPTADPKAADGTPLVPVTDAPPAAGTDPAVM